MNESQLQILRDELRDDEGLELEVYKDSQGFCTIGVGHLLGTTPRMIRITLREAIALLEADIEDAERLAREAVPLFDTLTAARQRALVNMAFNRGQRIKTSTTITPAINAAAAGHGTWQAVGDAIAGSEWADQVKRRAERLSTMLVTGLA